MISWNLILCSRRKYTTGYLSSSRARMNENSLCLYMRHMRWILRAIMFLSFLILNRQMYYNIGRFSF